MFGSVGLLKARGSRFVQGKQAQAVPKEAGSFLLVLLLLLKAPELRLSRLTATGPSCTKMAKQ